MIFFRNVVTAANSNYFFFFQCSLNLGMLASKVMILRLYFVGVFFFANNYMNLIFNN